MQQGAASQPVDAAEAGSIAGVIVDPTGALVPRATVTTVNTDSGWRMVKQTDNTGKYSLSPLPPGPYNVEVEAKGFQRQLQENVQVKPGQRVGLNLKLTIGGASQSLTVTGSPEPQRHHHHLLRRLLTALRSRLGRYGSPRARRRG